MDTETFATWLCAQCEADRGDRIGWIATRFVGRGVRIGHESEDLDKFWAAVIGDVVAERVLKAATAEYESLLRGEDFYDHRWN